MNENTLKDLERYLKIVKNAQAYGHRFVDARPEVNLYELQRLIEKAIDEEVSRIAEASTWSLPRQNRELVGFVKGVLACRGLIDLQNPEDRLPAL